MWDLFQPEVWNKERETYQAFRARAPFAATDEALAVYSTGGPTEEYVRRQVELVSGDVLSCLEEFGVPFLRREIENARVTR